MKEQQQMSQSITLSQQIQNQEQQQNQKQISDNYNGRTSNEASDSIKQQLNAFTFNQQTILSSKIGQNDQVLSHQRQLTAQIKKQDDQEHTRDVSYMGSAIILNNNKNNSNDFTNAIEFSNNDDVCHAIKNEKFEQQIKRKQKQTKITNSFNYQQQNNFNNSQQVGFQQHSRQQSASLTCGKPEDALDKNHTRQESYIGEQLIVRENKQKSNNYSQEQIFEFSDQEQNTQQKQQNFNNQSFQHFPFIEYDQNQEIISAHQANNTNGKSRITSYTGSQLTDNPQYSHDQKDFLDFSDNNNAIIQSPKQIQLKQFFEQQHNEQNPFNQQKQMFTFKGSQITHDRQASTATCGPAKSNENEKHTRQESYIGEDIINKQEKKSKSSQMEDSSSIDLAQKTLIPDDETWKYIYQSNTVEQMQSDKQQQGQNERTKSRLQNELNPIQQENFCSQSDDNIQLNRRSTTQHITEIQMSKKSPQRTKQNLQLEIKQSPSQQSDLNQPVTALYRDEQEFQPYQQETLNIELNEIDSQRTAVQQQNERVICSNDSDSYMINSSGSLVLNDLIEIFLQIKKQDINKDEIRQLKQRLDQLQQSIMYSPAGELTTLSTYIYSIMTNKLLDQETYPTQWILDQNRQQYKLNELIIYDILKDFANEQQKEELEEIYQYYNLKDIQNQNNYTETTILSNLQTQQMQLVFCLLTMDAKPQFKEDEEFIQFYKQILKIMYEKNDLVCSILK